MNHRQERVYGHGNTYILEPFLVKVMHEKDIALKEQNISTSNIFTLVVLLVFQKNLLKNCNVLIIKQHLMMILKLNLFLGM